MDRKSYGQTCPMGAALDVVGDRWTILLLRELLGGAGRFTELYEGLPGIAKNLLSSRLVRLEEDGIIRRVSSGSAMLYGLTERGFAIRPTLEHLGFWGAGVERVGPVVHQRSIRAIAMALQAIIARVPAAMPKDAAVVELDAEGKFLEIRLGPRPTVTARATNDADGRFRIPFAALPAYLSGDGLDPEQLILVSGDPALKACLLRALGAG
ncbi:MAG: DNA-binding HxlR family transcriptional regulator [Myxococcota bacterium]|jgi:DNA-binding HxlR family transcriptional regulator